MTTTSAHATSRNDRLEDFRKLLEKLTELSNAEFDELDIGALMPVDISVRVHVRRAEEPSAADQTSAHT
ncbi:hypothetical protein IEZ26_15880 [Nocardioides cavernae]|uniref:Acyl carrier protein n=1 Tax=Nocardioides cavernae TaxID=1921566 RepID=A0ABR8NI20_9ACTN|nr:hypothetical protein [Nocardioides cavernae]MBD3926104.1 hypothetical protein [Nocardioides cavernae]MBM7513692.1 hypothetical protein [Nocardioides cavernae]